MHITEGRTRSNAVLLWQNVNQFIVSQVNPHVAPFYAHLQGRAGRPSGGRDRTGAERHAHEAEYYDS